MDRLKEIEGIGSARTNRMTMMFPEEDLQQELKSLVDKRDDAAIIGCLESQSSNSNQLFKVIIIVHVFYIEG